MQRSDVCGLLRLHPARSRQGKQRFCDRECCIHTILLRIIRVHSLRHCVREVADAEGEAVVFLKRKGFPTASQASPFNYQLYSSCGVKHANNDQSVGKRR
jgi:hypothetical protein